MRLLTIKTVMPRPSTQPKTQQKIGGIPVKKAGGFTFGATNAATNKNPGSVGNTTNKPAFNFGGSTASTKPVAFNFGNSSNAGSADSKQPARKKPPGADPRDGGSAT